MERIKFGRKSIEYSVKKGNRKNSVAINVTPTSQVIVLAPHFLSLGKIKGVVTEKAPWILKKQGYFRQLSELYPEKEFESGEQILLLGRKYRLKLIRNKKSSSSIIVSGRKIFVSIDNYRNSEDRKRRIKDMLTKWYISETEYVVKQRVHRFAKFLGIKPREIKVKEQKKRWGSCSNKGTLRFNWRISMAPISIIDYIVVHELCHVRVKNHSPDFWRLVSLVLPDYQKRRDWLKNNFAIFKI